ncbi:MAG TPA: KTSC domain-containing protein [Candidatus Sulfotelmatobacter sp.]|nr:KTSC domain-containing protein [Candidatus Sulfotelmatobacter sp.]
MSIEMVPVDSSHLKAVGYDPRSQKMRVQFKNNVTYEYQGITPELHHAVTNWISSGSAFSNLIKSRFKGKIVG